MHLPRVWETFLNDGFDIGTFHKDLDGFLSRFETIIPEPSLIFQVFREMGPAEVRCVLFGEDPYPRRSSACGIAFWDKEVEDWQQKTNGNALKNILKALLIYKGWADYQTDLDTCRKIAGDKRIKSPAELFRHWLDQGVFLVNTSLTFSGKKDKAEHFRFWKPFFDNLIERLNQRMPSPLYVLWGNHAGNWKPKIEESIDDSGKIIRQSHPTFAHQFLDKNHVRYSPFKELSRKTGINWL